MIAASPHPARAAYTLIELITVVVILGILVSLGVPAFKSMLYSSERSRAVNSLNIALATAQAASLRPDVNADTAAYFAIEPGGRMNVHVIQSVGTIMDKDPQDASRFIERDIFAPVPFVDPVQLPSGWMARGYAPVGLLHTAEDPNGWYDRSVYRPDTGNWLFPESGFYDRLDADGGARRGSFMIRFQRDTGNVLSGSARQALVLDPRPSASGRSSDPYRDYRADKATDYRRFVRGVLDAPESDLSLAEKQQVLGDESGDTVLTRALLMLAVSNESRVAKDLGARLDPGSGLLYQDLDEPRMVEQGLARRVNNWIEGREERGGEEIVPDVQVFSLSRYSGRLQTVEREGAP